MKIAYKTMIALGVLAVAGSSASVATAGARAGCNGVVNPFVWGCAPWDNNNGPNYPYYKKNPVRLTKDKAQIVKQNGVDMVKDINTGKVMPLIGMDGSTIIAAGGGN